MPKLLRLSDMREAHLIREKESGREGDIVGKQGETGETHRLYTIAEHSQGLRVWSECLEKGVLPTFHANTFDVNATSGPELDQGEASILWPCEPLRSLLLGAFARLKLATLCSRFPQIQKACLSALLDVVIQFEEELAGDKDETNAEEDEEKSSANGANVTAKETDGAGAGAGAGAESKSDKYQKWLAAKKAKQQGLAAAQGGTAGAAAKKEEEKKLKDPKYQKWLAAKQAKKQVGGLSSGVGEKVDEVAGGVTSLSSQGRKWWSGIVGEEVERTQEWQVALKAVDSFYATWEPAVAALSKANSTFNFLDILLGSKSETFNVHDQNSVWRRKGWDKLDEFRQNLEKCKPLRDLVRSLGRGAGWGPLRRSPVQALDMSHGREGLLRSILEQQETRGLCRSDDLARMLPSEACMLAKGRTKPVAKRLFFAKFVQQSLLSYERDGWHEQPTKVPNPLIREVRPTADRGPILLCIDTSGSMRGVREKVAKALTLECMRAAKEQDRGCYVYCFSGPSNVRELELSVVGDGADGVQAVDKLLDFLEKVFNGGSDLNEPLKRCMDKLMEKEWANSDVLIVSDGELRSPAPELMKKIAGAKQKHSLRVHGVTLPAAETVKRKAREDEKKEDEGAVLRSLCSNRTYGGKEEVCVHVFKDWDAFSTDVFAEEEFQIAKSVEIGRVIEEFRQKEIARLQDENKKKSQVDKSDRKLRAHPGMKYDKADKKDKKLRAHPGMNKY